MGPPRTLGKVVQLEVLCYRSSKTALLLLVKNCTAEYHVMFLELWFLFKYGYISNKINILTVK